MMDVSFLIAMLLAVAGGLLSFLSPCVLPLVPAYISVTTGLSYEELTVQKKRNTRAVLIPALLFSGGFTAVFVALGAGVGVLGGVFLAYRDILNWVAGMAVILLGLHLMGVLKVGTLLQERRLVSPERFGGRLGAFLAGGAFALGWTPCIGPVLGGILALGASSGGAGEAAVLLLAYSAGLAIPFIGTALLFNRALGAFSWFKRHYREMSIASGFLLILLGVLLITGGLTELSRWIIQVTGGWTPETLLD